ncbi:MAG: His/Gly/Thr/Pro-type tRNA ligase C-terminal domain-containing protein, partial [Lachnospiraceae bacterium]|nr:His/Gly/Thr/Pro-type tRNA ligase C-terminal domain-containing protein [Lachnospiraceae bacterium]
PIWPITIAPWEVHLCCMRPDTEDVRKVADGLYEDLQMQGVEVIYDDRTSVRAGEMFADADLIGAPIRVVVSPRNLKNNVVEVTTRDKSVKESVAIDQALEYIAGLKQQMIEAIEN